MLTYGVDDQYQKLYTFIDENKGKKFKVTLEYTQDGSGVKTIYLKEK